MAKQSEALFQRAQEVIPGGVNSPVRAFGGVGGSPLFIEMGQGGRIFDADNLQYIDCVGSWGPMILGHGHRYVVEAVKKAATRGFSFGAPTSGEIELAEMIDRKSTRLNSSHSQISYAVFCLKKKKKNMTY